MKKTDELEPTALMAPPLIDDKGHLYFWVLFQRWATINAEAMHSYAERICENWEANLDYEDSREEIKLILTNIEGFIPNGATRLIVIRLLANHLAYVEGFATCSSERRVLPFCVCSGNLPDLEVSSNSILSSDLRDTASSLAQDLRNEPLVEQASAIADFESLHGPQPDGQTAVLGVLVDSAEDKLPGPWARASLNIPSKGKYKEGQGITIAVIDAGFYPGHPDLVNNQLLPPLSPQKLGQDLATADNWCGKTFPSSPSGSHGCEIVSIMVSIAKTVTDPIGVARGSMVLPFKVSQDGTGYPETCMALGVVRAAMLGAKIINLSVASQEESYLLSRAITIAIEEYGCLVVASAGDAAHFDTNAALFPASTTGVVSVSGFTQSDDASYIYSKQANNSMCVDFAAPGEDVAVTTKEFESDTGSGTSFSAPIFCAAAAVVWSNHPEWTAQRVIDCLRRTGEPVPGFANPAVRRIRLDWALAECEECILS